MVALFGKVRVRQPDPVDIKDVVARAGEAQGEALQQAIANTQQFGGGLLSSQFQALQEGAPEAFGFFQDTLSAGSRLIDRLISRGATDPIAEAVRAGQAARGVALSPRSALQEGLAISQARTGNLAQALSLGQRLSEFGTGQTLGIRPFQPDIPGLGALTGQASQLAQFNQRNALQNSFFSANQNLQAQAGAQALAGRGVAGLAGFGAGALGLAGGAGGLGGGFLGAGRAAGFLPTQQVQTTQGPQGQGQQQQFNLGNRLKNFLQFGT